MLSLPSAFGRAVGQIADPAILKVLAKSIALTLVILLLLGTAGAAGIGWLLGKWQVDADGNLASALVAILFIVGGWLLFRIVALAVLQFYADDVVEAVEARHYPRELTQARKLPLREEMANGTRAFVRTVLANLLALVLAIPLLATAIGPAVIFFLVNAWLLGRELQDIAWLRHRHTSDAAPPLTALTRLGLGAIVAGLLLVPFVNFLAPVFGASAATHLVHLRQGADRSVNAHAA